MKLVVKDSGGFMKVIYGITLNDGHLPTLNTLTDEQLEFFHIPDIEPAVWFKILIIESAVIDCAQRNVTWFTSKALDDSDVTEANVNKLLRRKTGTQRISESTFLTSEHVQYLCFDFDEVFIETKQIIQNYKQSTEKDHGKAEVRFFEQMFSVLHRFVLPAVTLKNEDQPHLQAALDYQTLLIERQDEKICAMNSILQSLSADQFTMREKYYETIFKRFHEEQLQVAPDVAMLLYNHVQEDLSHYSQQLTEIQTDVNLIKEQLKQCGSSSDVAQLAGTGGCRSSMILSGNVKYEFNDKSLLFASKLLPERFSIEAQMKGFSTGRRDTCATEDASTGSTAKGSQAEFVSNLQLHLTRLRQVRDQVFDRYKTILQIREILGEFVCDRVIVRKDNKKHISKRQIIRSKLKTKSSSSKHKRKNELHAKYVELETRKQERLQETSALLEHKVQMISVKEAIRLAMDELKSAPIAFGIDIDRSGSLRSTDVNKQRGTPAQWLSIREQVAHALEDTTSTVRAAHIHGSQRVILQCNLFHKLRRKYLLSESDSPDNISIDSSMLNNVLEQSTRLSFYDSLASNRSIYSASATPLSTIRRNPRGSARNTRAHRNR